MATVARNTIAIVGPYRTKTCKISGTPTPGMLAVETSTAGTYKAHATAGGTASPCFFLENEELGREIGTAYAASEQGKVGFFAPGDEIYALLADGETAVVGSYLESNGDGYLRVVDADASIGLVGIQSVVAVAKEAVDMSGTTGADPNGRIRVEAI